MKALELLDERVSGSREWTLRRVAVECAWLDRPLVLKKSRAVYPRPARRHSLEVEMMVVRLYEHLGRTAYLLDERELHDLAVLRCVNLAMLMRRRVRASSFHSTTAILTGTTRYAMHGTAASLPAPCGHPAPQAHPPRKPIPPC